MNERLKLVRESLGLNVRDFGERLGMSGSAISLLETGKRNITPPVIKSICREYNINETWLLTGNGEMNSPVTKEQEIASIAADLFREGEDSFKLKIVKLVSQMTDEQIEMCKDIIKKLCE